MKIAPLIATSIFALAGFIGLEAEAGSPSAKIDQILAKSWKEAGLKPNPPISDEVFVRRIYLDAVGRIPTAAEAERFIADTSKDKRAKLIDELIESEGYVNHFYNYWADILRVNSQQGGGQNIVPGYIEYVRDSLRDNKPYDQFVRELVTAEGNAYQNGAIGYYYRDRGMPLDNMANTVRIFLGTRLECAQCHDHPFDSWTQMDFFHMAAFSYGMSTRNNNNNSKTAEVNKLMREMTDMDQQKRRNLQRALQEVTRPIRNNNVVSYDDSRKLKLPHDYQYDDAEPESVVEAGVMFGQDPEIVSPGERLHKYAEWMTSKENPRFATVIANRLWKRAMGIGLIEPVDEMMESSQPTNPELMAYLTEQMKAMDFDMKAYLKMVFKSQAYQRAVTVEEIEVPQTHQFVGPVMRRMSAEQVWDSIVTLVNPTPDVGNWKREKENAMRLEGQKMLMAAMNDLSPEYLLKEAQRIAQMQKDMQKKLDKLVEKQAAAREAGDAKKARELAQEGNRLRNSIRSSVYETIYKPAMQKAKLDVVSLDLPEGMGEIKMTSKMLDSQGRPTQALRKQLDEKQKIAVDKEMDALGITDPKQRSSYSSFRRSTSTNYVRAAHVGSPAPANHFIQEFGQSDRETIQNAEDQASVPQALTMLNGPIFNQIINSNTVVSRAVAAEETAEGKLNKLFLSMLAREPNEREKKLILSRGEERGDELYKDVVFALLNNQEFLFIR